MSNDTPPRHLSVRFSPETRARVVRISRQLRLPVAEIVRRAVENQLPAWERDGEAQLAPGELGTVVRNGSPRPAVFPSRKRRIEG